jgi:3-deoxy-D-manno-octulosonic-acid transferase
LADLEARLAAEGLSSVRLSELEPTAGHPAVVVIVDRVGVLAEIYALADIAYVGGGFGPRGSGAGGGLHSVLEPAALGVPVLYGPRHANAREAAQLIERGGAREVAGAGDLEQALRDWLANREARQAAGAAAAAFIEENLGAGRRNAELVLGLLGVD